MRKWLLPTVVTLFVIEILMLPLAVEVSYAGRSESPEHILTYTKGELLWDAGTQVDENGTAKLRIFKNSYQNVNSEDGEKVAAPGTGGTQIIRLKNESQGPVGFTAVFYELKSDQELPVKVTVQETEAADVQEVVLPQGVEPTKILGTAAGTLPADQLRDFEVNWDWIYEESDQQDEIDTQFGESKNSMDEITVGLYLVVEDNNEIITPGAPKTGDNLRSTAYLVLLGMTFLLIVFLAWNRRWEKKYAGME